MVGMVFFSLRIKNQPISPNAERIVVKRFMCKWAVNEHFLYGSFVLYFFRAYDTK